MKSLKFFMYFITLISLYGCTNTANPHPVDQGMVSSFSANTAIFVKNAQTIESFEIEQARMTANLREVTGTAITLLESELLSHGIRTEESASRSLELSVDRLVFNNYFMAQGCTLSMTVKTGNGLNKPITVENVSGGGLPRACDFAITMAVARILNDNEIRNYIMGSSNTGHSKERLIELKGMLDSGLITIDEYNNKKYLIIKDL